VCASENQFCTVPYPTSVRFGANGRYATVQINRGVTCARRVFGDPIPGVAKRCEYRVVVTPPQRTSYRYCAPEGGTCSFRGTERVAYGVNGQFRVGTFVNGARCTNDVFGDPAPGKGKACYIVR